jgi:hypothetical protein
MIHEFQSINACRETAHTASAKTLRHEGDRYLITHYDTREYLVSYHGFVARAPQDVIRAAFRKLPLRDATTDEQNNVRVILTRVWDRQYMLDCRHSKQEIQDRIWHDKISGHLIYPDYLSLILVADQQQLTDYVEYEVYRG